VELRGRVLLLFTRLVPDFFRAAVPGITESDCFTAGFVLVKLGPFFGRGMKQQLLFSVIG
jgi:hypothetical protein